MFSKHCHVNTAFLGTSETNIFSDGLYLIVTTLGVAGIGRLVSDEHVMEVCPGEGDDGFGMVRQVGDEAFLGWLGDIED